MGPYLSANSLLISIPNWTSFRATGRSRCHPRSTSVIPPGRTLPASTSSATSSGRVQAHPEDVALDVEAGSVLPGGITEVERGWHGDLPVARNEVQFGIDIGNEFAERYGPIEHGDGSDVQGYLFTFQVKEGRVDSRQTATEDRRFVIHLVVGSGLRAVAITGNWRGWPPYTARPPTLRCR